MGVGSIVILNKPLIFEAEALFGKKAKIVWLRNSVASIEFMKPKISIEVFIEDLIPVK